MIEKTIYISVDGKQFETKERCLRHEQRLEPFKLAKALKDFCVTADCKNCPFLGQDEECFFVDNSRIPANWDFDKKEKK